MFLSIVVSELKYWLRKGKKWYIFIYEYFNVPVKVELVNILTIFELTAGKDFKDPAKIESIVVSSIFYSHLISLRISFNRIFNPLYPDSISSCQQHCKDTETVSVIWRTFIGCEHIFLHPWHLYTSYTSSSNHVPRDQQSTLCNLLFTNLSWYRFASVFKKICN